MNNHDLLARLKGTPCRQPHILSVLWKTTVFPGYIIDCTQSLQVAPAFVQCHTIEPS